MVHKLFLLLCIAYSGVSYAQFSSSPFSRTGLGEPGAYTDPLFGAYGNASAAVMDSTTVNFNNPSSYSLLSKGQPLFSIGLSGRYSMYAENGVTSNKGIINLNQIALVIPANKYLGLAFGLQPFSRKGYDIFDSEGLGTDTVYYKYEGTGTTNKVFGGLSLQVLQKGRHSLGFGANYGYIFGQVTDKRYAYSVTTGGNSPGAVSDVTYRMHAGHLTLGMNYNLKLNYDGNKQLRIGAIYTPEQRLSAHRDYYLLYSDTAVFNQKSYTILTASTDDKGAIIQPANTAIGFAYTFRPLTGINYKYKAVYQVSIFGEVNMTNWSAYATDFRDEQTGSVLENTTRYSVGVMFTPNFNSFDKTVGKSYLKRMRYRAGGYFGDLPYVQNGKQLSEAGVTAGIGMPVASQRTNSSVNLSMQYGTRGQAGSGISEQFFSFNVGFIIAPSAADRWFRKTKLD